MHHFHKFLGCAVAFSALQFESVFANYFLGFPPSVTVELNCLMSLREKNDALGNILWVYSWAVQRVCSKSSLSPYNSPSAALETWKWCGDFCRAWTTTRATSSSVRGWVKVHHTSFIFLSHIEIKLQKTLCKRAG